MPTSTSTEERALVLKIEFTSGSIDVHKIKNRWRYTSEARGSLDGEFLGLKVYAPGSEKDYVVEIPGEEAFWERYGDIVASHKNLLPPEDAKPIRTLDLGEKNESEEFNIWVRIPNFLLPIYHSLDGKPDFRRDGNYAWVALNLRHRLGNAVWTLGVAAGADTKEWLWFKDANWGATMPLKENAGAESRKGKRGGALNPKDVHFDFTSIARHVSIPAPFPSPSPRSFLTSACERILGLDPAIRGGRVRAGNPASRLHIAWERGPKSDPVLRPVLRRWFWRTSLADEGMFQLGGPTDAQGLKETAVLLVQKPRRIGELKGEKGDPRLLSRRWQLHVSTDASYGNEEFKDERVSWTPEEYRRQLERMFKQSWDSLIRSLRPGVQHDASAMFGIVVSFKDIKDEDQNPLPILDLAFRIDTGGKAYPKVADETSVGGLGQFRVEPKPPNLEALPKKRIAFTGNQLDGCEGSLFWHALRDHRDVPLETAGAIIKPTLVPGGDLLGDADVIFRNDPATENINDWHLKCGIVVNTATQSGKRSEKGPVPIRAGSLDIVPATEGRTKVDAFPCPCQFYFRREPGYTMQWNTVTPLKLALYGFGWEEDPEADEKKTGSPSSDRVRFGTKAWSPVPDIGLRIPIENILPGEADHHEGETESLVDAGGMTISAERPLVIGLRNANRSTKGDWVLELSEIAGQAFTPQFTARIKLLDPKLGRLPGNDANALKTLYIDRTPFFVGLLDHHSIVEFAPEEGNEAAYFSTKGIYRGWQLRSTSVQYRLHLPPQGVAEAMEKGKRSDGYDDIGEGEVVEFRFPPISTLTLKSSDFERRYGPAPWNLRLTLNALKENGLAGLPLKAAEFEMLYGLRMKIQDAPYLRVAEVLARLGLPRPQVRLTPVNSEYLPNQASFVARNGARLAEGKLPPAEEVYQRMRRGWKRLLNVVNSRLAVYEVFDDRQVEFNERGEPVGLVLEGNAEHPVVTAELRKAARLRVSMAAERNPGPNDESSPALSNHQELKLLRGKTRDEELKKFEDSDPNAPIAQWWSILIPNYDDGIAGSFAWAFESRLLYESLWAGDPRPDTPMVVEAVEATLARLYFSALGGWSSQRAAFANGKIVVVVSVEMGRVSELRVEVIGRIGIFWNKAKLVTVFRRSVLPSDQFQDQQDLHEGRPLLRKVEEYVEFLEKSRLANDAVVLRDVGQLEADPKEGEIKPGCLKACCCDEKILVDSRWGTDVYDATGAGVGVKIPLRKAGAPAHIYKLANLMLHFHANEEGPTNEVAGRIENLEDVLFWTDVRLDKTANTDTWPAIVDVDVFPASPNDPANPSNAEAFWADKAKVQDWQETMVWGTPPVGATSTPCTFRVAGITKEASLNRHLLEGNPKGGEQRPVGAILRNVTVSRGTGTVKVPDDNALRQVSQQLRDATSKLRAAGEHSMSFLEQVATRTQEAGERVFGWETKARNALGGLGQPAGRIDKLLEDLHPVVAVQTAIEDRFHELSVRIEQEAGHLFANATGIAGDLKTRLVSLGQETVPKQINETIEAFRKARIGLEAAKTKLLGSLENIAKQAAEAHVGLKKQAEELLAKFEEQLTADLKPRELLDSIRQDIRHAATTENGVENVSLPTLANYLTDRVRNNLHRLFINRLREIAGLYADPKRREEAKRLLLGLVRSCFSHEAIFQKRLVDLWDSVATNTEQVTEVGQLVAMYLDASARAVADCFARGYMQSQLLDRLLVENAVLAAAAKIQTRVAATKALLETAAELHEMLVPLLRRELPNWAFQSIASNGALDSANFIKLLGNALDEHCRERIAALESALAGVGEQMMKRLGTMEQLGRALKNAAFDKIDDVKGWCALGGAEIEKWRTDALAIKDKAWGELKSALQAQGKSPISQMAQELANLQKAFTTEPDKLKRQLEEKFSGTLQKNVGYLVKRADRELRGITDLMRTDLGSIANIGDGAQLKSRIEEFKNEWLVEVQGKQTKLAKALGNISGTTEHALELLGRGKKAIADLKTKLAALDQLNLPNAGEEAKRKARNILRPALQCVEDVAARLQVPWLRNLPKKLNPEPIAEAIRRIHDALEVVGRHARPEAEVEAVARFQKVLADETARIRQALVTVEQHIASLETLLPNTEEKLKVFTSGVLNRAKETLDGLVNPTAKEIHTALREIEEDFRKDLESYSSRIGEFFRGKAGDLLEANPAALFDDALARLGLDKSLLADGGKGAMKALVDRLPGIGQIERGLPELQGWVDRQRGSLNLMVDHVRGALDVVQPVQEARQALVETYRAFGQTPKMPSLNFKDMATLGELKNFGGDVKGYINNLNARLGNVSYAFDNAAGKIGERLRMTPVKTMVDRMKNAAGGVVEEVRMRAATVESAVRNIGEKIEADARRMIDDIKPSLKDLLPDFGGLKLEKLLAAAGLSDSLIRQFQEKLKTKHHFDPQSMSGFVDCKLDNLLLDSSLTVFSFGPVSLRLRNVKMSSHLRIEAGQGKDTRRKADGKLTADWDVLVGGSAVITYEQAALENVDGRIKMQLDPKKVRMPSVLQSVADTMKGLSAKDDSGLQVGIINRLPTEITGYVKFNLDVASAGAPTSGIQNLRISLFFELGLRFPRFPSLEDADLRISAGAGLSDKEAPFIFAIWILGGCGWFTLRLDYVVPFKDGAPRLDIRLNVGLGVSASLAFDCGFASGSVYVALAVEIECLISKAKGQSRTTFSMVLTMAGNLNILGIISVQLLIVLSIGYSSPGPMIGTGMIRVKIKICWCFTLKVERSFTKRFSGGGGQGMHGAGGGTPALANAVAPVRMPSIPREPIPARRQEPPMPGVHRKAARMIV